MSAETFPPRLTDRGPPGDGVVKLEHVTAADRALVGGKAANLGALRRAGLPVPAGFCVTTAAFRRFLAESGAGEFIQAELNALDPRQPMRVRTAARRSFPVP